MEHAWSRATLMPNASPFWSVRDRLKLRKLRGGPKLPFLGYGFLFESLHPNAEGRYCSKQLKNGNFASVQWRNFNKSMLAPANVKNRIFVDGAIWRIALRYDTSLG